jgi:hypothetical protein
MNANVKQGGRPTWIVVVLAASVLSITLGPVFQALAASDSLKTAVHVSIILPPSLELRRSELTAEVNAAIDSAASFFARHGFSINADSVIDSAYIFATVAAARTHCAARFGVPEASVPKTFGGTVNGHILLAVAPAAYKAIFSKLYGAKKWSEDEYRKLLVHELAHRIHALIAVDLFGSEDGMGPRWFFEGLAIRCAGQFNGSARQRSLSRDELQRYIEQDGQDKLPSPIYPIYRRMFDAAASRVSIHWLISHAGDSNFVMQLLQASQSDAK